MVPQFLLGFLVFAFAAASATAQSFTSRVLARDIGDVVSVAGSDFDGDGDVDLVASTVSQLTVFYFDHRPVDTLIATVISESTGEGRDIATGDFDGDGDIDVVVAANDENRLTMFRNGPGATPLERFTQESFATDMDGPFALAGGSFSGDGLTGLVATEISGVHRVRLFRQLNGDLEEIWVSQIQGGIDPLGIAIADTDNDSVEEILIAGTSQNGGLFVLRRNDIGGYDLTQEVTGVYLVGLAAADLDDDGALDVIGCDYVNGTLRRYEKTGTGWTSSTLNGGLTHPRKVVIEDFNADGLLDIAATGEGVNNGGNGGVAWWRQTSSGSFVIQPLSSQNGFYGLDAIDYDRDGDIDLVAANSDIEQIVLFENRMGTPTRIIGHVTSEREDEPVGNVLVTALETGVTGVTDANGRYELGMIEGVFSLRYTHPCWETAVVTDVQTFENDTTTADATLRRPRMELPVSSLNLFAQNQQSSTYELWISNTGDAVLTVEASVSEIVPQGNWVSVSPLALEIAPGSEEMLAVTLTPDTTNDHQFEFLGSLELSTNSCPDTAIDLALVVVVLDAPERQDGILPTETRLAPAYPNPFNPSVSLPVDVAHGGEYSLRIYDVLGREAQSVYTGALTPGRFVFSWHAKGFASGRYIAVLESADGVRWETPLTLIK